MLTGFRYWIPSPRRAERRKRKTSIELRRVYPSSNSAFRKREPMPSTKAPNKPGHITTGNVLEDLGFSPEEIREIEIQSDLWVPIRAEIEARKLTQSSKLAKVLKIHQPDARAKPE